MFNLHQLEIFGKVVQCGSFSKAAKDLLMTQSAVSQHIRNLEVGIGAKLFNRGAQGVSLTEAGQTLHSYTQQLFDLLDEAQQAVQAVEGQQSTRLRIGATPGVSVYLLPEWLSTFRHDHPTLAAEVQTDICSALVEQLRVGNLDVAVVEGEVEEYNYAWLSVHKLYKVEQVVVVGHRHPWRNRTSVTIKELDGQRFIMREPDSHTRLWLDGVFNQHQVSPKIDAVLDNIESIKRAVSLGDSISILPPYTATQEAEQGTLHTVPIVDQPLIRTLRLLQPRKSSPIPSLPEKFIAYLGTSASIL